MYKSLVQKLFILCYFICTSWTRGQVRILKISASHKCIIHMYITLKKHLNIFTVTIVKIIQNFTKSNQIKLKSKSPPSYVKPCS